MTEICRRLGVSTHRFQVWQRAGRVPAPAAFKGKREVWSEEQVAEIRKKLPELLALRPFPTLPDGYFTSRDAAKELGVPHITWQYWIRHGSVPKPSRRILGVRWALYSEADLDEIREKKEEYFGQQR